MELGYFGVVSKAIRKSFDIESEVFFAELNWDLLMKDSEKHKVQFFEISRFPEVSRDLALLIDKSVTFAQIEQVALKSERKLLKNVVLFDVYEGKNLPEGKKSYAVNFIIQDEEKTLTDKQIDKVMSKIQQNLQNELGAQLR
jgi:phenylalanyl-tRNA synthetase beta chain